MSWRGRRVLVTGHTGFKGAWLTLWLHVLGARVSGLALAPPTTPSLFALARVEEIVDDIRADVRDAAAVRAAVARTDSSKARARLSWRPVWDLATGLAATAEWYATVAAGEDARAVTLQQIADFERQQA